MPKNPAHFPLIFAATFAVAFAAVLCRAEPVSPAPTPPAPKPTNIPDLGNRAVFPPELWPELSAHAPDDVFLNGLATLYPGRLLRSPPAAPAAITAPPRETVVVKLSGGVEYVRFHADGAKDIALPAFTSENRIVDLRYFATGPEGFAACERLCEKIAGAPPVLRIRGKYQPVPAQLLPAAPVQPTPPPTPPLTPTPAASAKTTTASAAATPATLAPPATAATATAAAASAPAAASVPAALTPPAPPASVPATPPPPQPTPVAVAVAPTPPPPPPAKSAALPRVIILVNGGTSGPIEAMLADLQARGRVLLVGLPTAGNTLCYTPLEKHPGWWSVSGEVRSAVADHSLAGIGAEPSVRVKFPKEAALPAKERALLRHFKIPVAPESEADFLAWQRVEQGEAPERLLNLPQNDDTPRARAAADAAAVRADWTLRRGYDVLVALQIMGVSPPFPQNQPPAALPPKPHKEPSVKQN
ncbi:MAG: hypothetical protein LBT53_03195 [Puniceicoccales bacterium]|jgi:hypothetical protein|nr:hypothetical protein [Puniceicoccales bacterium]